MGLVHSFDDSNASDPNTNTEAMTGSVGMVGFTKVPYPKQMPARNNADVKIQGESIGALGNDGTNMEAYEEQPIDLNSETGK